MKTKKGLVAALFAAGICSTMVACSNNDGTVVGGGTTASNGVTNDGTLPTNIVNGGVPISGNFVCTESVVGTSASTVVGTNGVVGGVLTTLLSQLGLTQVAALLASVSEPDNAIDGNLDTFSTVTLTAGLLGTVATTVDESVVARPNSAYGPDQYAVFAVSFPAGVANLSVFSNIRVSTFLNDFQQETNVLDSSGLTLLGLGTQQPAAYIGLKANKSFDRVTISVTPLVLSANVGAALRVHELCIGGHTVPKPA